MENTNLKTLLRLFPYISDKKRASRLKIDDDSIHFISLREVANKITSIITYHLNKINIDINNISITDATAGVGGNTLSFGMNFKTVNAIELDDTRYEYLINNINIYDLQNINTYNDDCMTILPKLTHQNVVFIDPPWGGKDYKNYKKLKLSLSSTSIEDLCNNLMDPEKNISCPELILLKLPTNYDVEFLFTHVNSNSIYLHELKKMLIIAIINNKME